MFNFTDRDNWTQTFGICSGRPHKVRPKNVYVLFTEKGNIIIFWYYYCENYKLIFQ